nr:MAG TPA: hypothetical protein [Caudoviricetes sp.]
MSLRHSVTLPFSSKPVVFYYLAIAIHFYFDIHLHYSDTPIL